MGNMILLSANGMHSQVFFSTLSQMGFLLLIIAIGYLLSRLHILPEGCAGMISKLENNIFIPALVLGTFSSHFTVKSFTVTWKYLLCGTVAAILSALFAITVSKICSKDRYIQNIYTYGLSFSNFGFMGNAVVAALFPDVFMDYLVFVIPFWVLIYIWGVPGLLMPKTETKKNPLEGLKKIANPMFVGMLVGMLLGITSFPLPSFVGEAVNSLGNCMSPLAMLLTGITIAKIDLKTTLRNGSIYLVSIIRLVVMPLIGMCILFFVPLPYGVALCTVCALAMPLGLNTIVVPAAYGNDTSVAAGMALISHLLSCLTIPIIFMLFNQIFA